MRLTVAGLMLAAAAHAQQVCEPTPVYTPCELVFDVNSGDPSPVEIRAEIKSPKFKTAMIGAFEEKPNRWVIRFSPTDAGEYQFRVTSNVERFNGKTGSAQALAAEHPGYIRPANLHHWIHPDTLRPHLWTAAACLDCFTMERSAFEKQVEELTASGANHLRVRLGLSAFDSSAANREIDGRLRFLSEKRVTTDLILADTPQTFSAAYPSWQERERFAGYVVNRFAPFDITWLIFNDWEDGKDGRAMAREIGTLLKKHDPYDHPRSTGARMTSASLSADGWMDYINIGSSLDALPSVEHQFFTRPFVSQATLKGSADEKRKRFWNLVFSGQYAGMDGTPPDQLKLSTELLGRTRFWELEPWFDVDGGRALAVNDVEYLAYIEKPSGPIEVSTEKHSYQVYWIDPATGVSTKAKDYKGEKFVSEAPDKSHDWLLHLSRDGRKEGLLKSYKFESRQNYTQEIEYDPAKVPFQIVEPSAAKLPLGAQVKYEAKITRETRATRDMMFVWSGEVVADGQGYRVFSLDRSGAANLPRDLATKFPGVLNVRLSAINANGKAYALDRVYQLVP